MGQENCYARYAPVSTSGVHPERRRRAYRRQPARTANFLRPAANISSGATVGEGLEPDPVSGAMGIQKLAGDRGFEPRLPDPESGVIPLDQSPPGSARRDITEWCRRTSAYRVPATIILLGCLGRVKGRPLGGGAPGLRHISGLPRLKPFGAEKHCNSRNLNK